MAELTQEQLGRLKKCEHIHEDCAVSDLATLAEERGREIERLEEALATERAKVIPEYGSRLAYAEAKLAGVQQANLGLAAALAETQAQLNEARRREARETVEEVQTGIQRALDLVEMEASRPTTSVGRILATITRERAALAASPEPAPSAAPGPCCCVGQCCPQCPTHGGPPEPTPPEEKT